MEYITKLKLLEGIMARSFSRSLARAVVNGAQRAARERERERVRAEKQRQRAYEKALRAQERELIKRDKEAYVEMKHNEAESMTKELLASLDTYNDLPNQVRQSIQYVDFNTFYDSFTPSNFVFEKAEPVYYAPLEKHVPKESWLDNVFTSRVVKRQQIISDNRNAVNQRQEEYQQRMVQYYEEKTRAYDSWLSGEKEREGQVIANNEDIDNWIKGIDNYNEEHVLRFVEAVFDVNWFFSDMVKEVETGYVKDVGKLILEIHMSKKEDIFPYEGYKYFKTRDSIEPVKMKVTQSNQRIRDIMLNIAISILYICFQATNTRNEVVKEIVINVLHEGVCCVSGHITRAKFEALDLNITSHYNALFDNYIKVGKQLTRGVKPYERIYSHLGLD